MPTAISIDARVVNIYVVTGQCDFYFATVLLPEKVSSKISSRYIFKRKSFATVFRPLFLQHGPYEDIFIIIYNV